MRTRSPEEMGEYLSSALKNNPTPGVRFKTTKVGELIPVPSEDEVTFLARGAAMVTYNLSSNHLIPAGLFKAATFMGGDVLNSHNSVQRESVTTCETLYIERGALGGLMRHVDIKNTIEATTKSDNARIVAQMQSLAKPADGRVADALLYLSVDERIPGQDLLALQANATRQYVNRIIAQLSRIGVIHSVGNQKKYITESGKESLRLMGLGLAFGKHLDKNETQPNDEQTDNTRNRTTLHFTTSKLKGVQEAAISTRFNSKSGVSVTRFPRGSILFSEGGFSENYYLLASGSVVGYSQDSEGRGYNGALFTPPSLLGEPLSKDQVEHDRICEALNDSLILQINRKAASDDPELRQVIDEALESDGKYLARLRKIQGMFHIETRLAAILLQIKEQTESTTITLNQKQLAMIIGGTRSWINRTLAGWKERGIISASRRLELPQSDEMLRELSGMY